MRDLVDAKELAKRFKVTPATVHAWHRRGWIPCLRAGRRPVLFDVEAVENALRQRTTRRTTTETPSANRQHAARIVFLFTTFIHAWQTDKDAEANAARHELQRLGINVEIQGRNGGKA